jgi:hypothetical protein
MDRDIIAVKKETVSGTAETIINTDFLRTAYELGSPDRTIEKKNRKLTNGNHGSDVATIGKQSVSIAFSMDITYFGSPSVEPEWGKCLEACGYLKTAYTTTGIGYAKSSLNDCGTVTIEHRSVNCENDTQLVTVMSGCIGQEELVLDSVGNPVKINFVFTGKLVSEAETGSLLAPVNTVTAVPDEVIGSAITYGANELYLDSFTFSGGNEVVQLVDPSDATGINHYAIASYECSFSADPEITALATDTINADELAGTTRAIVVPIGANITLTIPEVQVIESKTAERNGVKIHNVSFGVVDRDGTSGIEILIGAKA